MRSGEQRRFLNIDNTLGGIQRYFQRLPDTMILGPTGRRLWATYIEKTPGFTGRIDYIHKTNIPSLFALEVIRNGEPVRWEYTGHTWYPSHLKVSYRSGELTMTETKFITWDDCACDLVSLANLSSSEVRLDLRVDSDVVQDSADDVRVGERKIHGQVTWFTLEATHKGLNQGFRLNLPPGNQACMGIVMAVNPSKADAVRLARSLAGCEDALALQRMQYQSWFDKCPTFISSDPYMDKMWAYRMYLLRRNLADPASGRLRHPMYYEGRGLKVSDDPWDPRGWDFAKLIPFSTPFHILEGRWHQDIAAAQGELLNLIANRAESGLFRIARVDGTGRFHAVFIAWAAWNLYLAHPDKSWLKEVAPALEDNVRAWFELFDPDGDFLPHLDDQHCTGKEYQPSWFWFGGFPKRPGDDRITPLERVDVASYLYLDASAVSDIQKELGSQEKSRRFAELADRIRKAVLEKMWDAETRFFYDLGPDNEKAMVKNVVGFDPFFAGIAGREHLCIFDHLKNPAEFRVGWPVPSVSMDCAVFAPDSTWCGQHIKGPHGAVWNGPTWPFTNSTAAMALGNASRLSGHNLDSLFADLFRKYTLLMFRDRDIRQPNVVEHYNPLTGGWISREEDYFHSSWLDLVVTYAAGLQPASGGEIILDPIDIGLSYFDLDSLPYKGHLLRITWWDGTTPTALKLRKGLSVYVDGKLVGSSDRLGRPSRFSLGSD